MALDGLPTLLRDLAMHTPAAVVISLVALILAMVFAPDAGATSLAAAQHTWQAMRTTPSKASLDSWTPRSRFVRWRTDRTR